MVWLDIEARAEKEKPTKATISEVQLWYDECFLYTISPLANHEKSAGKMRK